MLPGLWQRVTALQLAAWNGHTNIVKRLIERGAMVNQSVRSIGSVGNGRRSAGLFAGRAERQHGVALGVLEESASDRRTSAGGIANWRPHVEGACIPALLPLPLQNNVDLSVEDRSGWTPLHFAARTGARNVVQVCPHLRAAGNICARTWPQICADSSKAAPGLTRVGAGTRPYLRRDWPASAQRLTHICTGTGPRLRRDWPTSTSAPGLARICICAGTGPTFVQQLPGNCMCGSFMGVCAQPHRICIDSRANFAVMFPFFFRCCWTLEPIRMQESMGTVQL